MSFIGISKEKLKKKRLLYEMYFFGDHVGR